MTGKHGAIDRILDALGSQSRRELLVALDDANPQPARGRSLDGESAREAELRRLHSDLPRLLEYGYVARDGEDLVKGPNWEEIEPVLSLLVANEQALPGSWP